MVCVFTILGDLHQTFSLDNGLALQELLLMWLKLITANRKSHTGSEQDSGSFLYPRRSGGTHAF